MTERIVLAYSGGADATRAIARLADAHRAEVVTVTLDVGQARDAAEIRDRALSGGAARAHVLDVREEFARDYALPALKGDALPDVTALAAPLVAAKVAEIARIETARVETPDPGTGPNLLCRPVADVSRAPDTAAQVDLVFEHGVPTSINGVAMSLTELVESLSLIAGRHAVGRTGEVEAPAAVVLHAAFRALGQRDGLVRISLLKGHHTVVAVNEPAPRVVTHA
jgi:argininosuccinate synthase